MGFMAVPLSVSPYSSTPVADAIAKISAIVGSSVTEAACQQLYWNDPATALGAGTGRWQFQISYNYQPTGDTDPVTLVVACQGNASTSVGGPKNASPPSFAGMTQSGCPLFPFGSGGGGGSLPGNAAIIREWVSPTSSQVLADMITMAAQYNASGAILHYWTDPQTAYAGGISTGSGQWYARLTMWAPSYVALGVLESGGCALSSVGGPPAVTTPAVWTGWTQVKGLFRLQ